MKAALLAAGILLGASGANAATLFSDNFNADPVQVPAGAALLNWTVTPGNGTGNVDVIGLGSGYDFLPGNGHYIDLKGTPGPAVMSTNLTFGPGTYLVEFQLAGNRRGDVPKDTIVSLGSWSTTINDVASAQGFVLYQFVATTLVAGKLSFGSFADGNANIGNLLDNVAVSETPLPAALPLFAAGLGVIGFAAKRRKRKAAQA
jgi:hypothetical protein